jgi:hypothetical protein
MTMARKPRPWTDTDTPNDRCVWCLARYAAFRGGLSTTDANRSIAATVETTHGFAAGTTAGAALSEDDADRLHAGAGMMLAARVKRGLWTEAHGPGRCVADIAPRGYSADDRDWNLRGLIATLTLGEEDHDVADSDFDPSEFTSYAEIGEVLRAA